MPRARWTIPYAAGTAALFVIQADRRETLTPGTVVALIALCVPLVWQRDRPLTVVVATLGGLVLVNVWVLNTSDVTAVFPLFIGPVYNAGRHERQPRAALALALYAVALPVADLVNPGFDPTVFVPFAFFIVPPWALGRALRSRSALIASLGQVNAAIALEREAGAEAAAAAERARIARELHDIVAHALSVMVLQAAGARLAVVRAPAASVGALHVVEEAGREAVAEMGRLLGVLRADQDAPRAGLAQLDELAGRARLAGLALEVRVDGPAAALAPTVDLAAYRIAQEAVTNAVKHAAPTRARLRVSVAEDGLHLVMEDDGHPDGRRRGAGTGHGLLGIRERVELHGGSVDAAERAGGGFRVHARLPVT